MLLCYEQPIAMKKLTGWKLTPRRLRLSLPPPSHFDIITIKPGWKLTSRSAGPSRLKRALGNESEASNTAKSKTGIAKQLAVNRA